jgi:parvulin-like peptidyl-prolyl isomerase
MSIRPFIPLLLAIACSGAFADAPATKTANRVAGTLGSAAVTVTQLQELIAAQPLEIRKTLLESAAAQRELLKAELTRRALLDEARKAAWDKRADVAYFMERAREQALIDAFVAAKVEPEAGYPSAKEIEETYSANLAQFKIPVQVRISQILLRIPENAAKEDIDRISLAAREVWGRLNKGALFSAQAVTYSEDDATRNKGGELGWVSMNDLLPNIRVELPHLKVGEFTRPIRTQFGWQIIKVIERKPEAIRPLAEVRDTIATALRTARAQQNRDRYVGAIQAPLVIQDNVLADIGLK